MKKKNIISLILLPLIFTLPGCGTTTSSSSYAVDEIEFVDDLPKVELGTEFDFEPYFVKKDGYTYTMEAFYEDDFGNEVDLDVNGFKFTQTAFADVFVTIHATKGEKSFEDYAVLSVVANPDKIDQWLYNIYLMEQNYITKTLNYDHQYVNGDSSRSSLKFNYYGKKFDSKSPCSFLTLMDYQNNERFSLRTADDGWDNAVFSFDAYNPNDYGMSFSITLNTSSVSLNYWNAAELYRVEPHTWGHFDISLRSLGQITPLVFNPEWDDSDHFYLQFVYDGNNGKDYNDFDFYLDNVDIDAYSKEKYPDLDTKYYNEAKDIFTQDENVGVVTRTTSYKKSEIVSYDEVAEDASKYSVKCPIEVYDNQATSSALYSYISGSTFNWKPMDISELKINFYAKPVNANNALTVCFDSEWGLETQRLNIDFATGESAGYKVTPCDNGWYQIHIDLTQVDLQNDVCEYKFVKRMIIRATNEGCDLTKDAVVYFDSLSLTDAKVTPYDLPDGWNTTSPINSGK